MQASPLVRVSRLKVQSHSCKVAVKPKVSVTGSPSDSLSSPHNPLNVQSLLLFLKKKKLPSIFVPGFMALMTSRRSNFCFPELSRRLCRVVCPSHRQWFFLAPPYTISQLCSTKSLPRPSQAWHFNRHLTLSRSPSCMSIS